MPRACHSMATSDQQLRFFVSLSSHSRTTSTVFLFITIACTSHSHHVFFLLLINLTPLHSHVLIAPSPASSADHSLFTLPPGHLNYSPRPPHSLLHRPHILSPPITKSLVIRAHLQDFDSVPRTLPNHLMEFGSAMC